MSDSQRPKPSTPEFDVPDLDLAPQPRPARRATPAPQPRSQPQPSTSGFGMPDLFDEDSLTSGTLSLEVDHGASNHATSIGGSVTFEQPGDFELEAVASDLQLGDAPRSGVTALRDKGPGATAALPTGRAPDPEHLQLDPIEVALLADYGEVPKAIQLAPAYAYRVFMRQRELKRQLVSIAAESERAELEREATLAELARAVRPTIEQMEQFRRMLAPLIEIEQVASQRGQALSSITSQIDTHSARLDDERSQLGGRIATEELLVEEAQRTHDEREASAKRAEAKLKRVHIEARAVTQLVEQKLGPKGGQIPDAEAAQLDLLQQRARAIEPEVAQARAELQHAKQGLERARASIDALRHGERQASRKKQALGEHFQKEVKARSDGMNETESRQRVALADLGRAVLGSSAVDVPEAWLERVQSVSGRADKLMIRRELQRRAIDSYDQERVRQGVRLALTVLGLGIVLIALKLIF